jgi:hypothetical protein
MCTLSSCWSTLLNRSTKARRGKVNTYAAEPEEEGRLCGPGTLWPHARNRPQNCGHGGIGGNMRHACCAAAPRVFFSLIGEARAARGRCLVWFAASFNPAKSSHTRHRRGTVLFIIFFFKGPSSLLDRVEYSGSKEWCVYHGVY